MTVIKTIRSLRSDYNLNKTRADCKLLHTKITLNYIYFQGQLCFISIRSDGRLMMALHNVLLNSSLDENVFKHCRVVSFFALTNIMSDV